MTTRGFLLGKFLPPHNGHLLLCDFARAWADEVTVLVCTLDRDPVRGALRYDWMRELAPACRILHHDRDVPQEPAEHPDFWPVWRAIVHAAHPEPIDYVFASEPYGERLAAEMGACFVPVDFARAMVPAAGSDILADPFANWHHLPPPVRSHFVKTVCVFGPESTGKSTLAKCLARWFDTVCVPEYARLYTEIYGTECSHDDLAAIAKGQAASALAASRAANRLVVLDTDPVLTCIWSDMLLGSRSEVLDQVESTADLYLLLDVDVPYIDDGTRYFPDVGQRRDFMRRCRHELEQRDVDHVVVSGCWHERFEQAVRVVQNRFPGLCAGR